jgi:hypothetical protein
MYHPFLSIALLSLKPICPSHRAAEFSSLHGNFAMSKWWCADVNNVRRIIQQLFNAVIDVRDTQIFSNFSSFAGSFANDTDNLNFGSLTNDGM